MSYNIGKSIGVAVGIIVGLIIAVLLVRFGNTNKKVKSDYDERQIRVRGDAYRYAFLTVMIYEGIMIVLEIGEIPLPIDGYLMHFAGVLLGLVVLSAYCIWNDAYWGINNNRRRYGIIFVAAALLNVVPVVGAVTNGTFMKDGKFTTPFINLMVCVMLLVIGVELLMKQHLEKRAEESEE